MPVLRAIGTTLGAVILLGACSESTAKPGGGRRTPLDDVLGEIASVRFSRLDLPIGVPVSSTCSYDGASRTFLCPATGEDGSTTTASFTLLDASGNSQSHFDPATTAAVRLRTELIGTVGHVGDFTGFVSESGTLRYHELEQLTLSGLLTGTHLLDGTRTLEQRGTLEEGFGPLAFDMTRTRTLAKIAVAAVRPGAEAWPLSGTVTFVDDDRTEPAPASRSWTKITYNGTRFVTLISPMPKWEKKMYTCTVDLATEGNGGTCGQDARTVPIGG